MMVYEKLYRIVFNGITDALDAFEREDYESAKDMLIKAQQAAEDFYVEDGNIEPPLPVYVLPHDLYSGEKSQK